MACASFIFCCFTPFIFINSFELSEWVGAGVKGYIYFIVSRVVVIEILQPGGKHNLLMFNNEVETPEMLTKIISQLLLHQFHVCALQLISLK